MKAHLLYRSQDFHWQQPPPDTADALIQDLGLSTLFRAMADGEPYLSDVAQKVVLASVLDPDSILFRQHVLSDCLNQPSVIKCLYQAAVETLVGAKKVGHFILADSPSSILSHAVEMLQYLAGALQRLRKIADENGEQFSSEGLTTFFGMLATELDDSYFATIADHLEQLRFRQGVMVSAELGPGNHGRHYVLRQARPDHRSWWEKLTSRAEGFTFAIADRDEAGARALSDLQGRGINLVANSLAQSNDHILSFFGMLRAELAFYVGGINLRDRLAASGRPLCFPAHLDPTRPGLIARDLCDVSLALLTPDQVVGNDVDADGRSLIVITGANQGGKSTTLRSLGAAQLMYQCGLFVTARQYCAAVCPGIFTHYKREEDATMSSGKLDEELARMSSLVDEVRRGSVVLFNESFAATNEREGSEIARQIVSALQEAGVAIWFVTHLYDFAHTLYLDPATAQAALFLRAERRSGGERTFRVIPGKPLSTSYGEDLYQQIFGSDAAPTSPCRPNVRSSVTTQ